MTVQKSVSQRNRSYYQI